MRNIRIPRVITRYTRYSSLMNNEVAFALCSGVERFREIICLVQRSCTILTSFKECLIIECEDGDDEQGESSGKEYDGKILPECPSVLVDGSPDEKR